MKRNHGDDKIDLGGVDQLDKALKWEKDDPTAPEPEDQKPTDDLDSHRTASEMDHPRGSVRMKHFDKQTRDAIQRILESLAQGNAEDISITDAGAHYASNDVEGALQEVGDSITSLQLPGVISAYGGAAAPSGWHLCDGTSLLRAGTYAALFTVIGTAFGTADGTHFNVPDLRGRFPQGKDGGAGRDSDAATRTAMNAGGNIRDNVGSVQDDASQGHKHDTVMGSHTHDVLLMSTPDSLIVFNPAAFGYNAATKAGTSGVIDSTDLGTKESNVPKTDGVSGAPRTASETRPINAYVNYIIKY